MIPGRVHRLRRVRRVPVSRRWYVLPLALATLMTAAVSGVAAQSVFGSRGLGVPTEGLDARTRGVGGVGVGLFRTPLLPTDPAAAAHVPLPSLTASMQPTWGSFDDGSGGGDLQGTRFPIVSVAAPLGPYGVVVASAGGLFDQRWAAERPGAITIDGVESATVDRFESRGGISVVRVGYAIPVARTLAVGASVGRYLGRVDRVFTRTFDTASVSGVEVFTESGSWGYSGHTMIAGAQWTPVPQIRLAGSASWGGELAASPKPGTAGEKETFDLPAEIRIGGSAALTPRMAFTAGFSYADWDPTDADSESLGAVGSAIGLGVGIEWDGGRLLGLSTPMRLGYRRADLPFGSPGESPTESVFAFGLTIDLARIEEFEIAGLDLALERGNREESALREEFWRLTASLRISGF